MKTNVLLLGSSHTKAIAKAASDVENFRALWVKSAKRDDAPGDITLDQAVKAASELSSSDLLAVTWIGTYHNIFGLVQHERPFDFFEPGSNDELGEEREIIPYSLLRDQFMKTISGDTVTKRIAKATKAKVVLLATPPVKGNNEFIHSKMRNYRGQDVAAMGVTPAYIRAKLWRLEMRCLDDYCPTIGAKFIPAPAEAITQDGFLREEFYADDATHANEAYGALVKDQILAAATAN